MRRKAADADAASRSCEGGIIAGDVVMYFVMIAADHGLYCAKFSQHQHESVTAASSRGHGVLSELDMRAPRV